MRRAFDPGRAAITTEGLAALEAKQADAEAALARTLTEDDKLELIGRALVMYQEAEAERRLVASQAGHTFVSTIRQQWRSLLLVGVVSWAVALGLNLALMAFRYGAHVKHGAPVAARGNAASGAALWAALSILITSIVAYRVRVGRARFWTEVREFPILLRTAAVFDGKRAASHLLWGFAGTMLVVVLLAPALMATLAVGVAFFIAGPARAIVVTACMTVWRRIGRSVAVFRSTPPPSVAVVVSSGGTGLALVAGAFVGGPAVRFALALLAAVLASLLVRRARAAVALVILIALPIGGLVRQTTDPVVAAVPATTGVISGTVSDARGAAVADVEVVANGPDTSQDTTDAQGKYSIKIKRGTYRVVPRDPKNDKVQFVPDYLDVELAATATADFKVKAAAGGGADSTGDDAASKAAAAAAKDAAAASGSTNTTAPPTTTPKIPKTLSTGSSAVLDFVVKAATKNLKPAPKPSDAAAAAAGSAAGAQKQPKQPTPNPPSAASPSNTLPPRQTFTLGPSPIEGDCLTTRRPCYYNIGFIDFSIGRHILKVGEKTTGTATFDLVYNEADDAKCQARLASGAVERCPVYSWSWVPPSNMAAIGGGPVKTLKKKTIVEAREFPSVECLSGKDIASATCEWVATAQTGGWITGFGAELQGFAAGSYIDGDFFAVIPSDVTVIEGTVRDEDGAPIPGVTVHIDGKQKYTVVTDSNGWYFQIVEPGDYEIYAAVAPALGFGKPTILPTKHATTLTVPKAGSAIADLAVRGKAGACNGGMLARLGCVLNPKVLALSALLLLPVIPGGMMGLGIADALSKLASPAGDLLKKVRGKTGAGAPRRPSPADFATKQMDDPEIRGRLQRDYDQYLRDKYPDLSWEAILLLHDPEKEANRIWGSGYSSGAPTIRPRRSRRRGSLSTASATS